MRRVPSRSADGLFRIAREHGLSLADLGRLLGCSAGHLSRLRRGERSVTLRLIDATRLPEAAPFCDYDVAILFPTPAERLLEAP